MTTQTETATDVFRRIQSGEAIALIDVRTPAEYREVHAEGARLVPLDSLDPQAVHRDAAGRPLVVLCKSGSRAAKACEQFVAAGIADAVIVEGGTSAWVAAGLPVIRGKKTMALERQVRISAGALVATGVGFSLWVHPAFIALSGFVGLGLVFAGVTDTCAMGMLMARMPWNRVVPPAACGTTPTTSE
jgi:rhodanese-related sulfurtransferase